jgi:hypothetical protein
MRMAGFKLTTDFRGGCNGLGSNKKRAQRAEKTSPLPVHFCISLTLMSDILRWQRLGKARDSRRTQSIPNSGTPSPHDAWRSTRHDSPPRTAAGPPQQDVGIQAEAAAAFGPLSESEARLDALQRGLVRALARIAELEAAELNRTHSARPKESPAGSSSSARQREGSERPRSGSAMPAAALEQAGGKPGAAEAEGLLHQRGVLRELLRAELRNIAKGRLGKRESEAAGSETCETCEPERPRLLLGHGSSMSRLSAASPSDSGSVLPADRGAALAMGGAAPPSPVVPSPVVPHPPSHSPEAEEDRRELLPPVDPGAADWPGGDGSLWSARVPSPGAEGQAPLMLRRFVSGCNLSSMGSAESAWRDLDLAGDCPSQFKGDSGAWICQEPPEYGASESRLGATGVPRPGFGGAFTPVVLDCAADGPNDIVRIVSPSPKRRRAEARQPMTTRAISRRKGPGLGAASERGTGSLLQPGCDTDAVPPAGSRGQFGTQQTGRGTSSRAGSRQTMPPVQDKSSCPRPLSRS